MKPKILVSACLLGSNCKYDGGNNRDEQLIKWLADYEVIPVCPECFGGLKAPRVPSELRGGGVFARTGEDLSEQFLLGAQRTLTIALLNQVDTAILKSRSPSCGSNEIYDGSFSGRLIPGDGVTAALLKQHKIRVISSDDAVFKGK